MKAKNGKCGVFAVLMAALLVTAALITSCAPEERIVYRDSYQYPEGKGAIVINAPQFNGQRTVLPTEPSAWAGYDLVIQRYTSSDSSGTAVPGATIKLPGVSDLTDPIYLAPGAYAVEVTAYTGDGKAAIGTSGPYPVMPGQATTIPVVIKPFPFAASDDGSEDGTFEYTIIIMDDILFDTLDITITRQGSTGTASVPVITETTPASPVVGSPVTLKPDSYLVFLQATIGTNTATFVEVVNIHQYLTSSATFTFRNNQFLASITPIDVDYDDIDIKPVLAKNVGSPTTVDEDNPITLALDLYSDTPDPDTVTITVTNATEAGYTSINWYSGSLTPIGTTASLTITAGTTSPFILQRAYPVTVVGVVTTDGISRSYSQTFTVVIGN